MPSPYRERDKVESIARTYGTQLPAWTSEYYQESIVALEVSDEVIEMVDIEVFDDTHAFMANGVMVHNSRGTNSQALSESNTEWKLEAARDIGIRPLLAQFQNFMNQRILPLIDEELSKTCSFKFVGLDAETAEKESVRLQQDMAVHMTIDEVLDKVEKKPLGKEWGGRFHLNPQWQQVLDKYVPVGKIMEHFFDMKGASQDPRFDYLRDPFYFNQMQMLQAQQQAAQQQQMAAQQPQGDPSQGQGQPQEGQDPNQPQDGQEQPQPGPSDDQQPQDLTRSLDQLGDLLGKSEAQMPTSRRRLIAQQRSFVRRALQSFEAESREALKEIIDVAEKHQPPGKKK
jgi:hypothetical protein